MARIDTLRTNLQAVHERISAAEAAAGRTPGSVQLLPVTKFHPASDIALLRELGITDVGENREQEARDKFAQLSDMRFHMIGQIQSKKANAVARWAAACHSVDSAKLAHGLDRGMALALERGDRQTEILDCFIQISADGDAARGGVIHDEVPALADTVRELEHLRLLGLMVVPPLDAEPEAVFSRARELADSLGESMLLSAGMSADLEMAIAAGSDIVRVGTDILGPRPEA